MARVLSFLIRYFSNYYTLHRSDLAAPLDPRLEHHGTHATFLDLDIEIKDDIFVFKLVDKRDAFSFEIVRMPFICSEIPPNIFYTVQYFPKYLELYVAH